MIAPLRYPYSTMKVTIDMPEDDLRTLFAALRGAGRRGAFSTEIRGRVCGSCGSLVLMPSLHDPCRWDGRS